MRSRSKNNSGPEYIVDITQTPVPNPGLNLVQQDLSDAMVGYWTQFARSGDPSWAAFTSMSDLFQSLQLPTPTTKTGLAADHKCAFWGLN